jgi:hypothetical protein
MRKISWRWWVWFGLIAAAQLRQFFATVSPFQVNGEWYVYDHMAHRFLEWAATCALAFVFSGLLPFLWAKRRAAKRELAA